MITHITEISYLSHPLGQKMKKKTINEFLQRENHPFSLVAGGSVNPCEIDSVSICGNNPLLADSHTVCISAQVLNNLSRISKRLFGINHKVFPRGTL